MVRVIVVPVQRYLLSQRSKNDLNFSLASVSTRVFLNTCKPLASVLSCTEEFPSLNALHEEISPFVHLKFVACKFHLLFLVLGSYRE